MNKVPFGTSDYPEPDPDAAAQAERDRNFNIGIEAAAAWHEQVGEGIEDRALRARTRHAFYATKLRALKRKVD
jgi:hypothetical protein